MSEFGPIGKPGLHEIREGFSPSFRPRRTADFESVASQVTFGIFGGRPVIDRPTVDRRGSDGDRFADIEIEGLSDDERARLASLLSTNRLARNDGDPNAPVFREAGPDGTVYVFELVGPVACVLACEPASDELVVPALLGGAPVAAVGASSLSKLAGVRSIALPDSVVEVGRYAFDANASLAALSMSRSGHRFDRAWVRACPKLETLALPGSLPAVEASHLDIPSLRTVRIGAGTSTIAERAFSRASLARIEVDPANEALSTDGRAVFADGGARLVALAVADRPYDVPADVTAIADKAFAYCVRLTRVGLPEGLVSIGDFAFFGSGIESCDLPSTVRSVGAKAFCQCRNLVRVSLDDALEAIGDEAFAFTHLEALELPRGLRRIGADIVNDAPLSVCGPQRTLALCPDNPRFALDADGGLYERRDDGSLELVWLFRGATSYRALPGTTAVRSGASRRNSRLRSLELPEGVLSIGDSAFESCDALASVKIPSTLRDLGAHAFEGTAIESIWVPASLEHIGVLALSTYGLHRESDPPTLRRLSVHPDNERFYLSSGILCERIGAGESCAVLYVGPDDVVTVPPEVVAIAPYAFAGADRIRELRIHAHLRSIEVRGLGIVGVPRLISLELPEPIEGQTRIDLRFPDRPRVASMLPSALTGPKLSYENVCMTFDDATLRYGSLYERGTAAIYRLSAPVYLDAGRRSLYDDLLRKKLVDVCAAFAERNDSAALDGLADLGYLDAETTTRVIDALGGSGSTAMTGHLLEMKRRRFGGARLDFDL